MNRKWQAKCLIIAAILAMMNGGWSSTISHAAEIVPLPPTSKDRQPSANPAPSGNPCAYDFDVAGPDGKVLGSRYSGIVGDGAGAISIGMSFDGALPDPEIVSGSHREASTRIGTMLVTARVANRSDFQLEKAGDPQPIYMREAPVIKIGKIWFVGDRIDFDSATSNISIGVDDEFLDALRDKRAFEIWWKGERRLTAGIRPRNMSPEKFSAQCLPVPAAMREQVKHMRSNAVMHRLDPSAVPQVLSFISLGGPKRQSFNPFDIHDKSAGSASFQLRVGRDGLVKQCDLVSGIGKVPNRPEACEIVRRWTRFYPATDRSGAPIESDTPFRLDWDARS